MKTVVVLGSKGMAGSMIFSYCTSIHIPCMGFSRPEFDVNTDWKSQLAFLNDTYIVINCIGLIPQKIKNTVENLQTYEAINTQFPHDLAHYCKEKGACLIHLSTNCVFEHGPSSENTLPDATDTYGLTKARGEPTSALVIRTSIIGPEPYGPFVSLLEWFLHSTSPVRGFTNHIWNGITTLELAKVIAHLVKEPIEPKVLHLFSPACVSKHELLCIIQKVYKTPVEIIPFVTNDDMNTTLHSVYPPIVKKTIEEQILELYDVSLRL